MQAGQGLLSLSKLASRTSRGSSCRPNQSQPLRLGLRGRISSGSASGHMMRIAASRCARSARSWPSGRQAPRPRRPARRACGSGRRWRSRTRNYIQILMFARAEARHGINVACSRSDNRYLAAEDQGCGNQGCLAWRLSSARCRAGGPRARANLKARSENRASGQIQQKIPSGLLAPTPKSTSSGAEARVPTVGVTPLDSRMAAARSILALRKLGST